MLLGKNNKEILHLMNRTYSFIKLFLPMIILCAFANIGNATELDHIVEVQKYNRVIHIMAMLLAGFGFLMVFFKNNLGSQMTGIVITVLVAAVTGFIAGKLIVLLGRRTAPYDDAEEFEI